MSDAPPDRAAEILAEVAELDLALARKTHGKAMAAEADEAISSWTRLYLGCARSVRQTLALKTRLALDIARADAISAKTGAAARAEAARIAETHRRRRCGEARNILDRILRAEADPSDYPSLQLKGRAERAVADADFAPDANLETEVRRLLDQLGHKPRAARDAALTAYAAPSTTTADSS